VLLAAAGAHCVAVGVDLRERIHENLDGTVTAQLIVVHSELPTVAEHFDDGPALRICRNRSGSGTGRQVWRGSRRGRCSA